MLTPGSIAQLEDLADGRRLVLCVSRDEVSICYFIRDISGLSFRQEFQALHARGEFLVGIVMMDEDSKLYRIFESLPDVVREALTHTFLLNPEDDSECQARLREQKIVNRNNFERPAD